MEAIDTRWRRFEDYRSADSDCWARTRSLA